MAEVPRPKVPSVHKLVLDRHRNMTVHVLDELAEDLAEHQLAEDPAELQSPHT